MSRIAVLIFAATVFGATDAVAVSPELDGVAQTHSYKPDLSKLREALSVGENRQQFLTPNGELVSFTLTKDGRMSPALADKYPDILSFRGENLETNELGYFTLTPQGLFATYFHNGREVQITPVEESESSHKAAYHQHQNGHQCAIDSKHSVGSWANPSARKSFGDDILKLRLAITTTGEYSAENGGTVAAVLANVVAEVGRINLVFERDLAITFELIADNDQIIFPNAMLDPFDSEDSNVLMDQNQTSVDSIIGAANYDIGHLFDINVEGGASMGQVCNVEKARAITADRSIFSDIILHQFAHQFTANHTLNGGEEICGNAGVRNAATAVEPGSASTLMGLPGRCGSENVERQFNRYFHALSIEQVSDFAGSLSCGVRVSPGNSIPVANQGPDSVIPQLTPFELTGSAVDADSGDVLTYNWEQIDIGPQTFSSADFVDDGQAPIFRSFPPTSSPTRTFPQYSDIVTGTTTYGEILPSTVRDLNFRFSVRDNKGGVAFEDRLVRVANAGPFTLTSPNANSDWRGGESEVVSWDVAGTDVAPINCANVDILFSADGTNNFTEVIVAGTANDGSETITAPAAQSDEVRVKVVCSTQPFFALSAAFKASDPTVPKITGQTALSTPEEVALALSASDLTISDSDNNNPSDFTLTVLDGDNYSVAGNEITPVQDFNGALTVPVFVNDGSNDSSNFDLSVEVTGVNDAPTAVNDTATVAQDSAATTIQVLANDTDPDPSETLLVNAVGTPSQGGTASIANNGAAVIYTPAAGFNGTETISYTVADQAGETSNGQITVTVTAAPVTPPTPPPSGGGGGGGGSFAVVMLLLLTLRLALTNLFTHKSHLPSGD